MVRRGWLLIMAFAFATCGVGGAVARPKHRRSSGMERAVPPPATAPSQEAVELATLAPPARPSTVEQTYGDAVYARRRLQSRIAGEAGADADVIATYGSAPYPCEPRIAATSAYVCNGAARQRSYGQGYAFTPDFLSAPQHIGVAGDEQTRLLPPITGLAWVVNSLRPDPHN